MATQKNPPVLRTIPLLIAICLLSFPAHAKYSGGTGEPNDPYQIATAEDLMLLGDSPEDYGKHFILTADIDLDPNLPGRKIFDRAVIAPSTDPTHTTPRNFQGALFTGVFDGDGHVIRNTVINEANSDYVGLFGYLGQNGAVNHLGLEDARVNGRSCVGGLAGYSGGGVISDCNVTAAVSGYDYVGGLVGWNEEGTISDCSTDAWATGHNQVGGLVGHHFWTTISDCYTTGPAVGESHVGGVVGHCDFGTILNCHAAATATGTSQVGGLAGYQYQGMIRNCYATGAAAGENETGGLVGYMTWVRMTHCYATGAVTGISRAGGLVGYKDSFSYLTSCFWDVETSGRTTSAGGTSKTTAEMKDTRTYQNAAWDFTSDDCDPPEWSMLANDYPLLAWEYVKQAARSEIPGVTGMNWQDSAGVINAARFTRGCISWIPSETVPPGDVMDQVPSAGLEGIEGFTGINLTISCGNEFSGGNGTAGDPYQIKTVVEWMLLTVRPEHWDKHIVLMADLDMLGLSLRPVGQSNQPFSGVLHGNGHVIRNTVIRQISQPGANNTNIGVVGYLRNGKIENLGVADIQVNGGAYAGGLVGVNSGGTVSCCYASGSVSVTAFAVGGLVGNNLGGIVSNCYASCSVTGPSGDPGPAGLVGMNSGVGVISNCYACGPVSGSELTLGLVGGRSRGGLSDVVRSSFWDIQTSGQAISNGGTGKTTAEMQTAKTFLDAGWDFARETANGTEDIWWILEGKDYPRLSWENAPQ